METGMRSLLCGTFLLMPMAGDAADVWHTFTNLNGRKLVAKVLSVESDSVVVEIKADGRQIALDLDQLSDGDVDFVNRFEHPAEPTNPDAPADASADGGKTAGNALYPRSKDEIRDGIREIGKRPKPAEVNREVHQATQQLNIYRFLCGVPSDVKADPEFSKNAAAAARACKENGGLSHGLGHSTNKCNLSSSGDVVASVPQYIADSGDNNRDARGHRAWCLNPPMGKVGFGSGGDSYSAMWCMDGSGKSITGTWAYPGKGLFPLDYLRGNAWSLYGAGGSGAANKLKVEVFKLQKPPEHPFPARSEIPGRVIQVNHVSTGMNAINFEPETPDKRGVYWVRVTGDGVSEGYLVELY
jgi:hypothetical protein